LHFVPCVAHFGEISLITEELRSATVKICSEHAKVLRMTKEKFDEIMSAANKIGHEVRAKIGRDVVDKVPLFKSLTSVNRRQLLEQMKPMQFLDASYICRFVTIVWSISPPLVFLIDYSPLLV
jgi:hypothetical protein